MSSTALLLRIPRPQQPPGTALNGRNTVGSVSTDSTTPNASTVGGGGQVLGRKPVLLSFDEIPEWFQRESNQWVRHGYRPISGSVRTSFFSWFYLYNESVNIYSHLIPAVVFLIGEGCVRWCLYNKSPKGVAADFIAFSVFILTATTCLFVSATYHTLMSYSRYVEHLCLRLDMLGVVIFILGDLVLGI